MAGVGGEEEEEENKSHCSITVYLVDFPVSPGTSFFLTKVNMVLNIHRNHKAY